MANRIGGYIICFLILVIISSCSSLRFTGRGTKTGIESPASYTDGCDSVNIYHSLLISRIKAEVSLDGEEYDARLNLYYVPDSLFWLSAVNSGFEIIRIGLTPDSTVYINRLEKIALIFKYDSPGYGPPAKFNDLELLINKEKICQWGEKQEVSDSLFMINLSPNDIEKKLFIRKSAIIPERFEFFHKKTGDYIVGALKSPREYLIYSNYIVDDLVIRASGGTIDYNRKINTDLSINTDKYELHIVQ